MIERTNRLHKLWLILAVLALMTFSLTACGGKDEPARVAERFLRAAVSNDLATLRETVDPDQADQVLSGLTLLLGLQALVGGGNEFVELQVETISKDGQRATVRASGRLRTTVLGVETVQPFEQEISLVKKDGQWYVTGP